MLNIPQGVLNRRVFNQSIYNQHVASFMLGQTRPYISKDKDVIDVGAAVGMYSFFWSQFARHVHSFEAVPPVYEQLKLVEQRCKNVTAYNKAVGKENGQADFYVDDKRLSNSSFRDLVGGQKITVDVVTLDSMNFDNVGFIKVDVEGEELAVLSGAYQLITSQRPAIMCEIYPKFNNGLVAFNFVFNI